MACGPGSPELSKSYMDMSSKLFTFKFKFTCSLFPECLGQIGICRRRCCGWHPHRSSAACSNAGSAATGVADPLVVASRISPVDQACAARACTCISWPECLWEEVVQLFHADGGRAALTTLRAGVGRECDGLQWQWLQRTCSRAL